MLDNIINMRDTLSIRQEVYDNLKNQAEPIVITNENFSGKSFWTLETAERIAENLHGAFPDAKVIIIIREQLAYLLSAYKYMIYTGHYAPSFKQFIEKSLGSILEKLCYDRVISLYFSLFGHENVCVMPVEHLKESREGFYIRLDDFTRLETNKSGYKVVDNISPRSWEYIEFLRRANIVLRYLASAERVVRRRFVDNTLEGSAHKIILYRLLVDAFAGYFQDSHYQGEILDSESQRVVHLSNMKTMKLTGLELDTYSYL